MNQSTMGQSLYPAQLKQILIKGLPGLTQECETLLLSLSQGSYTEAGRLAHRLQSMTGLLQQKELHQVLTLIESNHLEVISTPAFHQQTNKLIAQLLNMVNQLITSN